MGRWRARICLNCQETVNKRYCKNRCPHCGGKLESITPELIERLCLMNEKRKKKEEKRIRKNKLREKEKLTEGEIW